MMDDLEDTSTAAAVLFRPPVYQQRYGAVLELSRKIEPKKVIDMGCAECKLLKSLKFHKHIESLIGIDINESLLQSNQNSLQPLITDYLHRRSRPLNIQLFKGSIDEADSRMMDCDLFSCIEVSVN
ncbi:PREDICTED: small RNA 2'-O-methyltransferase-like [Amphimedon queenslandica]|uniref:Small RNA 2'-O-methyltransferase n=1 Tax=Amphimedon queenslandica TaxID=400682 RepID=A0AAN0J2N6_AMPQE|nr:PREDICTED: small RNA 2'-O-methyltransferase-like [Amphimedon queenslandica]|eukprot:XP_019851003.1 PREDICTED: small RNA 2'-O-methyltransferase-like [Amphimedon queenslandica]